MAGGAGLLAWSSGGFTVVETDRGASADIVADDVAVLGLTGTDSNGTRLLGADPFESGFTVTFTNQTAGTFTTSDLDVSLSGNVTGADGGGDVTLAQSGGPLRNQGPLAPTETAELEITNNTASNETATVAVDGTTDTGTRVQLTRQVTVEPEPAFFDVIIDDFDDPIAEGADMTVDVTVQNTGGLADTQTVQLNVDADQNGNFDTSADSTQITLDSGNSTSFSLNYTVQNGDDPALDFEVVSDDDSEERTTTVENGIVAKQATNMVPNADQQQQTFEFTLETALPQNETITITLEDAPQDPAILDYNNEGLVDDQGEGGSITLNENVGPGNDDLRFTYADGEQIPAGTDVTLRVPQIDLGSEAAQSDPYNYIFRRSDTERKLTFPVEISRDKGDSELTGVTATDLTATGPQTQQISFTPTTDMDPTNGVGELVAVDLSDAVDAYTNASVDNVQNASEDAFSVDTGSGEAFIRVDAGSGGVTAGTQVTVELSGVEAPTTGQSYEVGFSRGAADTTKETVAIDRTGLTGAGIIDIVPHADGQQQTFEFTLTEPLPAAETVTLTLPKSESPNKDGILDYNDTGQVDDGGEGGSITLSTNGTVVFGYASGDQIAAGTAVELRVPNLDVGLIADHDNPYNWDVTRTDFPVSTTASHYVERGRGTPALTNVSVTGLTGTNQQTQEFSFTPTTAMGTVGGLKETVAVDMTDFESIYDNGINSGVANQGSVEFKQNNNQTWLLYTPPNGGLAAGTGITITLDGAEPGSAGLGTTYDVGFSRGTADTVEESFSVEYVTFFDVTIVGTNTPAEAGETLTVDALITNTGAMSGTQTIRLEDTGFSNSQQDTTDETLGPGQSRTVTLEWPTGSGDAGSGDVTVESDDDSDATQVTVDTPAPAISSFSATNPSGQDVDVSFDSDEQLSTISVSLSGPESATLTETDISESSNGSSYSYQGTYSASTTGDYTATLNTATDTDGNNGASGQSDTVTIGGILDQAGSIVFEGLGSVAGDGGETESLVPSGVDVLGPPGRDLTGDGLNDLPFMQGGDLKIVDSDGNQQTLVSSGHPSNPETAKTLMAVGQWNGSPPSVFYVNENNDTIYRVDDSGSPTAVATPGDGAQAVIGTGDIDGDGTEELLFGDASQQVRYLEPDGTVKNLSGGQAGSNNGIGVGQPPDFDGDGVVREVLVNGSNQVKIVGEAESTITFTNTNAKKAPVTAADVDGDGSLEPVYVGSNGYIKYVDDPLGSPTIKTLNDANGNKVAADDELGVVSTRK